MSKPVSPGSGIAFAGTDVASGQIVLYQGDLLTSRETGILAAIGEIKIYVWRRPRVAVISTGDEIIAPGQPMRPGFVYDSNARIIADAIKELGGEPLELGIAIDDLALALRLGSKALRLHVLDCVSNNVKRDILDVLDGPPKQVTTVQEAQERVMVIVRDKVQKGIFSLNISNDEEYV